MAQGRKITSTQMVVKDGSTVVQVTVTGNNNNVAMVHPKALELVRDPVVLANVKRVVDPVANGGALINDAYHVRLEITQTHKGGGEITNNFKIVEVLDFKPAQISTQADLFPHKDK